MVDGMAGRWMMGGLVGALAVLACACSADRADDSSEAPTVERVIVTGIMTSRDESEACVDADSPEPSELLDTSAEVCGYALDGLVPPGIRPGSSVGGTLVVTDEGASSQSHFWELMWLDEPPFQEWHRRRSAS